MNINSIHGGQTDDYSGLSRARRGGFGRIVIDRRYLIEESSPR